MVHVTLAVKKCIVVVRSVAAAIVMLAVTATTVIGVMVATVATTVNVHHC